MSETGQETQHSGYQIKNKRWHPFFKATVDTVTFPISPHTSACWLDGSCSLPRDVSLSAARPDMPVRMRTMTAMAACDDSACLVAQRIVHLGETHFHNDKPTGRKREKRR